MLGPRPHVLEHDTGNGRRCRGLRRRRDLDAGRRSSSRGDGDRAHAARPALLVIAGAIILSVGRSGCGVLLSGILAKAALHTLVVGGGTALGPDLHIRFGLHQRHASAVRCDEGFVGVGERASHTDGANERGHDEHPAAPAARLLILGKLVVVLGLGLGVALLSIGVVALSLLVEGGRVHCRIRLLPAVGIALLRTVGHVVAEIVGLRIGLSPLLSCARRDQAAAACPGNRCTARRAAADSRD